MRSPWLVATITFISGTCGEGLEGGEALGDPVRVRRQAEVDDGDRRPLVCGAASACGRAWAIQARSRESPAVLAAQPDIVLDDQ